jgi:hypothetical protein
VQFRVSPDLRDALRTFAEQNGLAKANGEPNESAAARILLITVLGVGEGGDARVAALKAVAEEVIWATLDGLRESIHAELPKLVQRATRRISEGNGG